MGTINYTTSDYITMGLRPYDDFESDSEFMEEIEREVDEYGGTIQEAISDYIQSCYDNDWDNIEAELEKHCFRYFNVVMKSGYYEGFSIDIENNYGLFYDSYEDKREAQKEITEIKQFLIACAGLGLVACFPGWCTGFCDYAETLKEISVAIKAMREEVKNTPTWAKYNRESA